MKQKLSLVVLFVLTVSAMMVSGCTKAEDTTTPPTTGTNAAPAP